MGVLLRLRDWAKRLNTTSHETTVMWILAFREALAISNDNDLMRAQEKQVSDNTTLHVRAAQNVVAV
jgi:glutamate 5-kinase